MPINTTSIPFMQCNSCTTLYYGVYWIETGIGYSSLDIRNCWTFCITFMGSRVGDLIGGICDQCKGMESTTINEYDIMYDKLYVAISSNDSVSKTDPHLGHKRAHTILVQCRSVKVWHRGISNMYVWYSLHHVKT